MISSAQLEHETEQTRNELAQTVEELRDRVTAGQLVDDILDYARDTIGAEFGRTLRRQITANPLALCVAGAGLAWMMLSNGGAGSGLGRKAADRLSGSAERARGTFGTAMGQTRDMAQSTTERMSEWTADAKDKITGVATAASERLANATEAARSPTGSGSSENQAWTAESASSVQDTASSACEGAKSRAGSVGAAAKESAARAYGAVADKVSRAATAVSASASDATRRSGARARSVASFCADQPLLLGAVGLAVGVALGAMLPSSEAEDLLMGETSDRIKDRAQDLAHERIGKVKASGEAILDKASRTVEQFGLTGKSSSSPEASTPRSDVVSAQDAPTVPSLDAGVLPLQDAGMEPEEQSDKQDAHS